MVMITKSCLKKFICQSFIKDIVENDNTETNNECIWEGNIPEVKETCRKLYCMRERKKDQTDDENRADFWICRLHICKVNRIQKEYVFESYIYIIHEHNLYI